jgi:hypothetical protein
MNTQAARKCGHTSQDHYVWIATSHRNMTDESVSAGTLVECAFCPCDKYQEKEKIDDE